MEEQQAEKIKASPTSISGPGAMLRRAREDLRLAPDNVASILRLSPRQIQMLENDDYDSLPGATYVRGYLRSYSQLLGLSPDRVIDVYQQYLRHISPPPSDEGAAKPGPAGAGREKASAQPSTDQTTLMTLGGVALVILVLGILWWKGRDDSTTATQKPQASTTYVTESGAVIQDPAAARPASETPSAAPVAVTPPPARPESPAAPAAGATAAVKPPAAAPVPAAAKPPAELAAVTPPPAAVPATGTATPPTAPAPAAVRGRLVLRAMQESWADVRDGRQGRLLYETLAPGRVVTLEGVAPFSVFLGNADGVQVEFNGLPVDVSPHKRGTVARFTLGEKKPGAR